MLLYARSGAPFSTGSTDYWYRPTDEDRTSRIIVQVEFVGISANAVIDTGAPYVICAPLVASQLNLHPENALEEISMIVRGVRLRGQLYRLDMAFLATEGEPVYLEATAFVLADESEPSWGDLPSFIGLSGCLERIRFAVDPANDIFYFGPLI